MFGGGPGCDRVGPNAHQLYAAGGNEVRQTWVRNQVSCATTVAGKPLRQVGGTGQVPPGQLNGVRGQFRYSDRHRHLVRRVIKRQ
jgi:hypothetical protein